MLRRIKSHKRPPEPGTAALPWVRKNLNAAVKDVRYIKQVQEYMGELVKADKYTKQKACNRLNHKSHTGRTALQTAILRSNEPAVKALLEAEVHLNLKSERCLHLVAACEAGSVERVKALLAANLEQVLAVWGENQEVQTFLAQPDCHTLLRADIPGVDPHLVESLPIITRALTMNLQNFSSLLKKPLDGDIYNYCISLAVNRKDGEGRDITDAILTYKCGQSASEDTDPASIMNNTMRQLILTQPGYVWELMEGRLDTIIRQDGLANLNFLDPVLPCDNHPLMVMRFDQRYLLAHPLVRTILDHKWTSFGQIIYYLVFLIHGGALGLPLSIFLLFGEHPSKYREHLMSLHANQTSTNQSDCEMLQPTQSITGIFHLGLWITVVIAVTILLILETTYFTMSLRPSVEMMLEYALHLANYVLSVLFVIPLELCHIDTSFRLNWQWQLGVCVVLMVWIDFFLYIRKHPEPLLSKPIIMFMRIGLAMFQIIPLMAVWLLLFAMVLHVIFQNHGPFSLFTFAYMKLSMMLLGDVDYNDRFHGQEPLLFNLGLTYIFLGLFVIFMVTVGVNLMTSLAVKEISNLEELSEIEYREIMVDNMLTVENMLSAKGCLYRFWRGWKGNAHFKMDRDDFILTSRGKPNIITKTIQRTKEQLMKEELRRKRSSIIDKSWDRMPLERRFAILREFERFIKNE